MARSMWKGAIQFGLVTIPVKLYLATESKGISFHMLHAACGGRIQMKTWCPTDEEYLERSDTVKGFEIAPDQYVVVTENDLASVPLKTVRSIELEQFVPADAAAESTRFVKQAYYLEPEPIARKAFFLLKQILADRGLRAICKIVLRDREQLAALDPFASTMVLSTLYWPDEVRSTGELSLPESEVEIKPAERIMAEQLVAAMTAEFDPANYQDQYREALLSIIEAKASGAEVAPAPQPVGRVTDLMAALEASVAAARAERRERQPEPVSVDVGARRASRKATASVPVMVGAESEAEAAPVKRRKSA